MPFRSSGDERGEEGGLKRDIQIRLEFKTAKKLLEAFGKGVFDKLTPAQADAVSDFHFELQCQVVEAAEESR